MREINLKPPEKDTPQYEWVSEKCEVIAFRDGKRVRAFSAICPHMGAQLCFNRKTRELTCPWHGFTFNIDTGVSNHSRYRTIKEFEVETVGDKIQLCRAGED